MRTLIVPIVTLSLAIAAIAAAPARADDTRDIARILGNLAAIGLIDTGRDTIVIRERDLRRGWYTDDARPRHYRGHDSRDHRHGKAYGKYKKYKGKGHAYSRYKTERWRDDRRDTRRAVGNAAGGNIIVIDRGVVDSPRPRPRPQRDDIIFVDRIGGPGEGRILNR